MTEQVVVPPRPVGIADNVWDMVVEAFLSPPDSLQRKMAAQLIRDHIHSQQLDRELSRWMTNHQTSEQVLALVSEALLHEATDREWCDEYNQFVERINTDIGRDVLRKMDNAYSVTYAVTFVRRGPSPSETLDAGHAELVKLLEQHCEELQILDEDVRRAE